MTLFGSAARSGPRLLDPDAVLTIPDPEEQLVDLWDPVAGAIPGGTNHAGPS